MSQRIGLLTLLVGDYDEAIAYYTDLPRCECPRPWHSTDRTNVSKRKSRATPSSTLARLENCSTYSGAAARKIAHSRHLPLPAPSKARGRLHTGAMRHLGTPGVARCPGQQNGRSRPPNRFANRKAFLATRASPCSPSKGRGTRPTRMAGRLLVLALLARPLRKM
jgi:hypothetical protein